MQICISYKEQKILQKSGLHEAPPKGKLNRYYGIFRFDQKKCASLVSVYP